MHVRSVHMGQVHVPPLPKALGGGSTEVKKPSLDACTFNINLTKGNTTKEAYSFS